MAAVWTCTMHDGTSQTGQDTIGPRILPATPGHAILGLKLTGIMWLPRTSGGDDVVDVAASLETVCSL